ncbi:MAG: hypothetical protein GC131_07820 [Alphaproteobacteria bacterium]|nr:hypothetical protein [Alphaproteobacteria bacterium]
MASSSPKNLFSEDESYELVAIDQNSDKDFVAELAGVYAAGFNTVKEVQPEWDLEGALKLLKQRLQRPSAILAVRDKKTGKLCAGFFADIMPGKDGMRVSSFDIVVLPEHRNNPEARLGTRLLHEGMIAANTASRQEFGEDLAVWEGQTYKKLAGKHPYEWWMAMDYEPKSLFHIAAASITCLPNLPDANVAIKPLDVSNHRAMKKVSEFMARKSTGPDQDGRNWSPERAKKYLAYMARYNPSIIRVAYGKRGEVIGCFFGDTVLGRSGPHMTDTLVFADNEKMSEQSITALLVEGVKAADHAAQDRYGSQLRDVEMPYWSSNRHIWPILERAGLQEDKDFVHVVADADRFRDKIKLKASALNFG